MKVIPERIQRMESSEVKPTSIFLVMLVPHNIKPPIFATSVMATKAMTQQPYSDCWAYVDIHLLIIFGRERLP